jgi:ADP-ribosylglycohydrolase
MTYQEYLDKVYGGWLGKCLGGAAGAPVEGFKKLIPYEHYSQVLRTDLPNDDLDLQLLWLEVLQKKGIHINSKDLADAWEEQCWYPFSEYGIFLKNYERGIMPPYSGWFNNPLFKEGEGCPIRSEIWGMIFPGNPEKAASYAYMDAVLDHADASVWIEQYYAAIEASAFFESDVRTLILGEIDFLPEGSDPRKCVELLIESYQQESKDWKKARVQLMRKYAHFDFTNSITNLGIVILALLYGEGDMDKTINIAFRCGYDTDCTCATAGAILGIIMGAHQIPENLKEMVGDTFVIGIDVKRNNNSIWELAKETCLIGLGVDVIENNRIHQIPKEIIIPDFQKRSEPISMDINYLGMPALGMKDSCKVQITLKNNTDQMINELLSITQIPEGWNISKNHIPVSIKPYEVEEIILCFEVGDQIKELADKNILRVSFGEITKDFGICGANVWSVIGPYFEAMEKEDPAGLPSPHGEGCDLPTLECMVNNAVYLEREYINEEDFAQEFAVNDVEYINAYEDLLPLDEAFTFKGQGCLYLKQVIDSPEDRDVWVVIGNNDGFVLWVNQDEVFKKDEIRLWTPYNNYQIVHMKKGKNEIILKLLRRTESLKFSIGFRKYEGEHFHRKRWLVDLKNMPLRCNE